MSGWAAGALRLEPAEVVRLARSPLVRANSVGMDCDAGRHVAYLGQPCIGCGEPSPEQAPPRKLKLHDPVVKLRRTGEKF